MAAKSAAPDANLLNSSELLKKIDKLREKNVGKHVPLPQLVVVGDQSSGKSSLLESLTKIPFPRDLELCTRYATQITSRRETESFVEICIIPAPDASLVHKAKIQSFKKTLNGTEDFRSEFPNVLKEVNEYMEIRSDLSSKDGSVFSKDVLRIELCGPTEDYLTVIDVPGIFRDPTDGITTDSDIELVRDMVKNYIRDSRTVILAVLPSNVDIATQEILKLAKDYDVNGERTLGVLTKPDLVTEQSAKATLCSLVLGHKRPLTLGYHLVRNRGADENDALDHGAGERMFDSSPWSTLPKDKIGVQALRRRLGELLGQITEREFPELRKDLKAQIESCQQDLERLGPARQTEQEQRAFLSGIARRFQTLSRAARDAHYSEDAAFEQTEFRLLTHIVNLSDLFNSVFQEKAHLRGFERPALETDEGQKSERDEPTDAPKQTKVWARLSAKQAETFESLDPSNFPELEQIISRGTDTKDPAEGIKAWIEDLYLNSRGLDLGTFGGTILSSAFKEQTMKWELMTREYVSNIIMVVHRFLCSALGKVCANRQLYDRVRSSILDELLERYNVAMTQALFLLSVERNRRPYTLNDYFSDTLQKMRGARVAKMLEGNARGEMRKDRNGYWASSGNKVVDLEAVKEAAINQGNVEYVKEEIHDILWSYYKVACKRFVDSVYMQAVEHCLLTGPESPLEAFSQDWVINLTGDQLEAIAGESPVAKARRVSLMQKVDELTAALQILKF
ncbi:dynamin family protein [Aspergillus ibericus CBS 121593]|uniref:Uncharacterized protein n=1 Tax=Aspergillus ibericus CBS 121593 TaxID=1448316 RepID=A0A395HBZ8_9EURO|nr:hypothetical protein BO80DRAFT_490758 [Aspergillus ibericus CBS 121593]RAL05156.1 hypothetical protein BO80DRAFT_490758 [Aspergillus ibericus CBS 121593]